MRPILGLIRDLAYTLVSFSGIAFYPDHGEDMVALIHCADRAMRDAENSGKNRLSIYRDP